MFKQSVKDELRADEFFHLNEAAVEALYRALYDQFGLPEEPNRDSTEP